MPDRAEQLGGDRQPALQQQVIDFIDAAGARVLDRENASVRPSAAHCISDFAEGGVLAEKRPTGSAAVSPLSVEMAGGTLDALVGDPQREVLHPVQMRPLTGDGH